jgi:hypothetical protein
METKVFKISDLVPGPIRHDELPSDLVDRVKNFKEVLGDVEPSSLEGTIENFQRDMHPEREVEVWERIARAYKDYITKHAIVEFQSRSDVFGVLLTIANCGDDFSHFRSLTAEQIAELMESY